MEGLPLAGNAPKLKPRKEEDGRMLKVPPVNLRVYLISVFYSNMIRALDIKKYSYHYRDSKASMYRRLSRYK